MPEPELIQSQREILHTFRQATAQRAQAEADAAAHRKAERKAADAALNQARQTAEDQLAEARKSREEAQAALAQAGLQGLLGQMEPGPPMPAPGAGPAQELARCVVTATDASETIKASVVALQQWRESRAWQRRRLAFVAVVAMVVLMLIYQPAANFVDRTRRAAQLYRSAVVALEAGQWDVTANLIGQLIGLDPTCKDALALRGVLAVHYGELWLKGDVSLVHTLTGYGGGILGVVFSPDGCLLASGSGDRTVRLWRAK